MGGDIDRRAAALALLAAPLALAGCKSGEAADAYAFVRKEWTHLAPSISFVEHPSVAALIAAAPKKTRDEAKAAGRTIMAWSEIHPKTGAAIVHIVDPLVSYAPEWIGHEIAHVIYGRWHD
jgi:hypothetical protein